MLYTVTLTVTVLCDELNVSILVQGKLTSINNKLYINYNGSWFIMGSKTSTVSVRPYLHYKNSDTS